MKQLTVSFSRITKKITTLILTILLAAGLIPLVSTTVNAVDNSILDNYPIRKYIVQEYGSITYYIVICSNAQMRWISNSSYEPLFNPNLPYQYGESGSTYSWVIDNTQGNYGFTLVYNLDQWNVVFPAYSEENENFLFLYDYFGTESDTKPNNFPEIDVDVIDIEEIKNEFKQEMNATTAVTTSAQNIQNQVTNAYVNYSNGSITLTQLQSTIDSLASQLQALNNNSSATLADKVAINNAQLQVQIVQDAANNDEVSGFLEEIYNNQELTSDCKSRVNSYQNRINTIYNNFTAGSITQSEAITQVRNYITDCHYYIARATSQADIDAYNAVINAATGTIDSISNYKELDPDVSESAQQSDREELEYLENIEAETTDTIDSLKSKVDNSINESQANQVKNNVIAPILQNTLIVKVLPIAALFMVLAVTLGFKYRL